MNALVTIGGALLLPVLIFGAMEMITGMACSMCVSPRDGGAGTAMLIIGSGLLSVAFFIHTGQRLLKAVKRKK